MNCDVCGQPAAYCFQEWVEVPGPPRKSVRGTVRFWCPEHRSADAVPLAADEAITLPGLIENVTRISNSPREMDFQEFPTRPNPVHSVPVKPGINREVDAVRQAQALGMIACFLAGALLGAIINLLHHLFP